MIVLRDEFRNLAGVVDAQTVETEGAGDKREIGRRVIEEGRERASGPKELRVRADAEVGGMAFNVIENRNHRGEDAEEDPRDFFQRLETEFVAAPDLRRGEAIRGGRDDSAKEFAPARRQNNQPDKQ